MFKLNLVRNWFTLTTSTLLFKSTWPQGYNNTKTNTNTNTKYNNNVII